MKMIIAVVQDQDAPFLMDDMAENGIRFTRLASTGGFMRAGNTTLLSVVEDEQVDGVVDLIERTCKSRDEVTTARGVHSMGDTHGGFVPHPVTVTVGGAKVFVLNVDRMITI